MNKYYYIPQSSDNASIIAAIQNNTNANIINIVPIKIGVSPIKDQNNNDIPFYEGYYEIEWNFEDTIHNELIAIQGAKCFESANLAREFKQNGLV